MQTLPEWARKECEKCHAPIAYVATSRRSKGAPVEIAVDWEPDPGTGGTVPVALVANALVGNPVTGNQAAAMRTAGVLLRPQHAQTCRRRSGSHRRDA